MDKSTSLRKIPSFEQGMYTTHVVYDRDPKTNIGPVYKDKPSTEAEVCTRHVTTEDQGPVEPFSRSVLRERRQADRPKAYLSE
jgi:hypothetical protein